MRVFHGACLLAILCAVLYYRLINTNENQPKNLSRHYLNVDKSKPFYSSIWCEMCNGNSKCCEAHNIVFYPQERTFIFVLSEDSIMYGISDTKELNQLSVSSVLNHTELILPLAVMSVKDAKLADIGYRVSRPVMLLHRFKPDNVMHVLHDDLLPLYARYESLCRGDADFCISQNLLAFVDPLATQQNTVDTFEEWYKLLSKNSILNLFEQESPFILSTSLIGLPGDTIGYQYGFGQPHGPITMQQNSVAIFNRFAAVIKKSLNIVEETSTKYKQVLIISRKETRKILNEAQLIEYIKNAHPIPPKHKVNKPLKINILNLQTTTDITEIISMISKSDLIVAMHGASTYLTAVFSKVNSTIIELFPYGIQPKYVSPIQSLAQLPNCWFHYATWENVDPGATVVPDVTVPTLLGGLGHLSAQERQGATQMVPVPPVQCCHNATYLYRMFQDTTVGPSFQDTVTSSIKASRSRVTTSWTLPFIKPGQALDVTCRFVEDSGITEISFKAPINLSTLQHSDAEVHYDVTATTISGAQLERTESALVINVKEILISVWVKACVNLNCGKDTFVNCK